MIILHQVEVHQEVMGHPQALEAMGEVVEAVEGVEGATEVLVVKTLAVHMGEVVMAALAVEVMEAPVVEAVTLMDHLEEEAMEVLVVEEAMVTAMVVEVMEAEAVVVEDFFLAVVLPPPLPPELEFGLVIGQLVMRCRLGSRSASRSRWSRRRRTSAGSSHTTSLVLVFQ